MNRKNKLLALLGVLAALCVMTALAGRLSAPVDSAADDAGRAKRRMKAPSPRKSPPTM